MSTLLESTLQPRRALQPQPATRIRTLDGWRGVAILLVLIQHAERYGRFKDQYWTNLGSFGVDIFFVLSGYIITTRLISERTLHGRIDLRGFYLRRAVRILPLVVIYLLALCLVSRLTYLGYRWEELIGSLFFFRNYQFAANPRGMYTLHFWSLSIEEHFYLMWPASFLWLRTKRALWFATLCASASALWRFYEWGHPGVHLFPNSVGFHILQTDARLDGLFLGAALAILLSFTRVQDFILTNFQKETPVILLPAIALNLTLARGGPSFTLYLLIALAIAYTVIVKDGPMCWCLNLRPIVWVGKISYSLYIWQQVFLFHPSGHLPFGRLSVLPLNLICAFTVATCSFYFIERPAIEFGRRLYARKA